MEFDEIVKKRRSYRALIPFADTSEIIQKFGEASQLMCSCFNSQPWRYIFVYKDPWLSKLKNESLTKKNRWAKEGSMIIAVFSKPDLDCQIGSRNYYMFDTGMSVAAILYKATDLNLVAHPIAGFNPEIAAKILEIPKEYEIITLIIIGKKSNAIPEYLSEKQLKYEKTRPPRKKIDEFIYHNKFKS